MLPILKETGLKLGDELLVAHSPERILPGKVIEELRTNSRIVGGINEKSSLEVKKVYESIVEGEYLLLHLLLLKCARLWKIHLEM